VNPKEEQLFHRSCANGLEEANGMDIGAERPPLKPGAVTLPGDFGKIAEKRSAIAPGLKFRPNEKIVQVQPALAGGCCKSLIEYGEANELIV